MKRHSSWTLYQRLLRYIKPWWWMLALSCLGNMVFSAVDSYSTYLFKPLLDKGFIGKDVHFLKMLPLIILGLFLVRGLASFLSTYALGWMGARIVLALRMDMFKKLLKVPAEYFDQYASGKLLAKFTYNAEQVTQATGDALTTSVRQGFLVLGLLIVMFYTSWQFTLILFLVVPLLIVLVRYVSRRFRVLATRIQGAMGDINHVAEESILGHKEIRLFGAQDFQQHAFEKVAKYNFKQLIKMTLVQAANSPIIQMLAASMLALIVFAMFHHGAKISAGSFVTFLTAMLAILKPMKQLSDVNNAIQRGLAAIESIFEVFDQPEEADKGELVLKDVKGNVQFEQVNFAYGNGIEVLRDIHLTIPAGKTVALVGRSGAGKTSLVRLLPRFYEPTAGRVLIDNIDIQSVTLASLRSQIAMVSQHVILFDDTVYHNIALGDLENASFEAVKAAALAAHAWDFIEKLPQGLQTRIGENGMSLSGGQRQRLAIARAILKNAPILILDEATSALDPESERAIQSALSVLKAGRTTLIVAHRLSTIESADVIVVMSEGRIVEMGSHDELMQKGGAYVALRAEGQG